MGSGEGEQYQTAERNGTVKFYNGVQRKGSCFRKKQFLFWCNEMAKFYDDDCKVLDKAERERSRRSKRAALDLAIIIKWNGLPFTSQNTCAIIPRRANVAYCVGIVRYTYKGKSSP